MPDFVSVIGLSPPTQILILYDDCVMLQFQVVNEFPGKLVFLVVHFIVRPLEFLTLLKVIVRAFLTVLDFLLKSLVMLTFFNPVVYLLSVRQSVVCLTTEVYSDYFFAWFYIFLLCYF